MQTYGSPVMDRYVNFAFEVPWDTCFGTGEAVLQTKNSGTAY
jgi:hypothetical protein